MPSEDSFDFEQRPANSPGAAGAHEPADDTDPAVADDSNPLIVLDPTGPPVRVKRHPFQFTLRSMMLGVAARGGVFYFLSQNNLSTCAGATRSSRLKWQERQLEIEAAAQELQTESAGSTDQPTDAAERPIEAGPLDEGEQHE